MVIDADYVMEHVKRAANLGSAQSFCVAPQTVAQSDLRLKLGEGDDGSLSSARLDVNLARTVAAFVLRSQGWFLAGSNASVVRILIKDGTNFRVAIPANRAV